MDRPQRDGRDRIGVRDLRNQTAAAIRRAGAGERIVVTVDGRPVAQLGPLGPHDGPATLTDLAARGLAIAPRRADRPEPDDTVDLLTGARLDRLTATLRG
ncbi:MAG TPA: type II toxin-antitoxin system prevent-host-death family antitoxin [Acidimicrobiales bacterium]|jgi:prevent-host-death family protein|nr:type II toxin-antitoxin system prevent-host-death family antitoxin [Acidimicrobiales bacterium]